GILLCLCPSHRGQLALAGVPLCGSCLAGREHMQAKCRIAMELSPSIAGTDLADNAFSSPLRRNSEKSQTEHFEIVLLRKADIGSQLLRNDAMAASRVGSYPCDGLRSRPAPFTPRGFVLQGSSLNVRSKADNMLPTP